MANEAIFLLLLSTSALGADPTDAFHASRLEESSSYRTVFEIVMGAGWPDDESKKLATFVFAGGCSVAIKDAGTGPEPFGPAFRKARALLEVERPNVGRDFAEALRWAYDAGYGVCWYDLLRPRKGPEWLDASRLTDPDFAHAAAGTLGSAPPAARAEFGAGCRDAASAAALLRKQDDEGFESLGCIAGRGLIADRRKSDVSFADCGKREQVLALSGVFAPSGGHSATTTGSTAYRAGYHACWKDNDLAARRASVTSAIVRGCRSALESSGLELSAPERASVVEACSAYATTIAK